MKKKIFFSRETKEVVYLNLLSERIHENIQKKVDWALSLIGLIVQSFELDSCSRIERKDNVTVMSKCHNMKHRFNLIITGKIEKLEFWDSNNSTKLKYK